MISPKCDMCGKELIEFGAILLGPPDRDNKVIKEHICKRCYLILCRFMGEWYENEAEE